MLHSKILSTFIKLPFVIKSFFCLFYSGRFTQGFLSSVFHHSWSGTKAFPRTVVIFILPRMHCILADSSLSLLAGSDTQQWCLLRYVIYIFTFTKLRFDWPSAVSLVIDWHSGVESHTKPLHFFSSNTQTHIQIIIVICIIKICIFYISWIQESIAINVGNSDDTGQTGHFMPSLACVVTVQK